VSGECELTKDLSSEDSGDPSPEFDEIPPLSPGRRADMKAGNGPILGLALKRSLRDGYERSDLRRDILAGLVVGVVTLPLSMALAIASGAPPQYGLYTAIVAGFLTALLGGSRYQVTGPTAAFVAVLAPVAHTFGLGGLLLATALAGVALLLFGLARMGRWIEFVPYPVTLGFTAGIALVIAGLQLPDFLGLPQAGLPREFLARMAWSARQLPQLNVAELATGSATLVLLILTPRVTRRVPAPLVALSLSALGVYLVSHWWPDISITTINDRFSYARGASSGVGIPPWPPLFELPWNMPGPDGKPIGLSIALLRALVPAAFTIAMLSAIESLLSAVIADGMTHDKHDPDAELTALGIANIAAPFFGGIAATGAVARTALNIRSGARSPLAAITASLFALVAVLAVAPLLGLLPLASLAALLLVVAYTMAEVRHLFYLARIAPRQDALVLLGCLALTVVFDMVVAVVVGILLAAVLFMKRMAEVSGATLVGHSRSGVDAELPAGVFIYEIAGPLFFGAAQRAAQSIRIAPHRVRVLILDLRAVPAMDTTGLVSLQSVLHRVRKAGALVILAGVQRQPTELLVRAGIEEQTGSLEIYFYFNQALARARTFVAAPAAAADRD
jgi:SulP family sulfate permease